MSAAAPVKAKVGPGHGAALRPLVVLTGFLGSGKTTLLRRALLEPAGAGTAVLVNELGEVGLDQAQYRHVAERTVLLDNGCLCCVTREDLVESLRELLDVEESGAAPRAARVVVETTGMADPGPIVATLARDPVLARRFTPAGVLATCDAEHAATHAGLVEWQAQIACADVVAVTKADRADDAPARALVHAINPAAVVLDARGVDPLAMGGALLRRDRQAVKEVGDGGGANSAAAVAHADHTTGVSTASAVVDGPVDPALVTVWLSALLHAHGPNLLRVKALLNAGGETEGPLVLDAVQHTVYPPHHLPDWEEGERRSRLVAIARAPLDAGSVTRAFAAITSPAGPSRRGERPVPRT